MTRLALIVEITPLTYWKPGKSTLTIAPGWSFCLRIALLLQWIPSTPVSPFSFYFLRARYPLPPPPHSPCPPTALLPFLCPFTRLAVLSPLQYEPSFRRTEFRVPHLESRTHVRLTNAQQLANFYILHVYFVKLIIITKNQNSLNNTWIQIFFHRSFLCILLYESSSPSVVNITQLQKACCTRRLWNSYPCRLVTLIKGRTTC